MPDENRVFDVTKPKHVSPPPTSRPVIVGHHPVMNDPMVKEDLTSESMQEPQPTKIQISEADKTDHPDPVEAVHDEPGSKPDLPLMVPVHESTSDAGPTRSLPLETPDAESAFKISTADELRQANSEAVTPPPSPIPHPPAEVKSEENNTPQPPESQADSNFDEPAPTPHVEALHINEKKKRRGNKKWFGLALLLILVAGYLAADAGAFGKNINLPIHIFKHNNNTASQTSPPPTPPPAINNSTLPNGFKVYKLANTAITFAAPTTWGDATSVTEQGYSKRGGSNQPDGTYAYLVTFATNKDIQIAVTSNKYLPAARATQYYDFLQWCTGTNDDKFYLSLLHFTTTDKVDSPSTITCDQGPLDTAVKIDTSTLFLPKLQDSSKKVIGDVYVKNLPNTSDLTVFRVKDTAMTNGDNVKQLLTTVKSGSSTAAQ